MKTLSVGAAVRGLRPAGTTKLLVFGKNSPKIDSSAVNPEPPHPLYPVPVSPDSFTHSQYRRGNGGGGKRSKLPALFTGFWLTLLSALGLQNTLQNQQMHSQVTQNQGIINRANQKLDEQAAQTQQSLGQMQQSVRGLDGQLQALQKNLALALEQLDKTQGSVSKDPGNPELLKQLGQLNITVATLRESLSQLQQNVQTIAAQQVGPEIVNKVKNTTVTVSVFWGSHGATGSGFWIQDAKTKKMYILTAGHVAAEAANGNGLVFITPYGNKGPGGQATVVHINPQADLAVLELVGSTSGAVPVQFRNMDTAPLQSGESSFAIGAPNGLEDNITVGHVSHAGRLTEHIPGMLLLGTDTPINPGNSGGALFDGQGKLIGMNLLILNDADAGIRDGMGMSSRADMIAMYLDHWGIRPQ